MAFLLGFLIGFSLGMIILYRYRQHIWQLLDAGMGER